MRSFYNATAVLSKIRCIKDKHHMQSKYVCLTREKHLKLRGERSVFLSDAGERKLSMRACQCTVVHKEKKRYGNMYFINLIGEIKLQHPIKRCAPWPASTAKLAVAIV